ncbi:MAG: ornithine--oxo-acid transaminase, partial [Solirubrobacteraceae bacterium]|nr:ornithine--oxo-acid transaminase [Solirubrobacteraceae bacterium]
AAPPAVTQVRSRGLWFGLDLDPAHGSARAACERLLGLGVLAKDTHEHTIRLAPPLTMTDGEADWLLERLLASCAPWTSSIATSSPSCSKMAA